MYINPDIGLYQAEEAFGFQGNGEMVVVVFIGFPDIGLETGEEDFNL
jgi:CO dehydrogenase/acetyl-CoA synthase epsilon subunit